MCATRHLTLSAMCQLSDQSLSILSINLCFVYDCRKLMCLLSSSTWSFQTRFYAKRDGCQSWRTCGGCGLRGPHPCGRRGCFFWAKEGRARRACCAHSWIASVIALIPLPTTTVRSALTSRWARHTVTDHAVSGHLKGGRGWGSSNYEFSSEVIYVNLHCNEGGWNK